MDGDPSRRDSSTGRGKPWSKDSGEQGGASEQPLHRADARTIPRCRRTPTTRRACRSPRSSSAGAAPRRCRWCSSPSTGRTASSWARRWARRRPRPPPGRSASCGATRWRCCRSAATTWATTSPIGWGCSGKLNNPPKIFMVNWFRKDGEGRFLWPGYGENIRVLKWIVERINGRTAAERSAVGMRPAEGSLDLTGLEIAGESLKEAMAVKPQDIGRPNSIRRKSSSKSLARPCPRRWMSNAKPCGRDWEFASSPAGRGNARRNPVSRRMDPDARGRNAPPAACARRVAT